MFAGWLKGASKFCQYEQDRQEFLGLDMPQLYNVTILNGIAKAAFVLD